MPINENTARLVQLDTNALSNVLKAKDNFLERLSQRFPVEEYFFCFSPFSVLEIKKSDLLYTKFCELFSIIPSFLLKGFQHLWNEEFHGYYSGLVPDGKQFCLHDIPCNGKPLSHQDVRKVFSHPRLEETFSGWDVDKENIFKGILTAQENLGTNLGYSKNQVIDYVRRDSFLQIQNYNSSFLNSNDITLENVDINRFPSFKIMSFVTFYKFHADKRKPSRSDVYDILIAVTVPYVNTFVTEAQLADTLKKAKKIDPFIDHVNILSIKEI